MTTATGVARPLQFLAHLRVRFNEVDQLGHVNNAAYLTYLEQAAIDHAAACGFDMERMRELGGHFIARRHEIDFLTPAHEGDVLRVRTWIAEHHGARAFRVYDLRRVGSGRGAEVPPDAFTDGDPGDGDPIVGGRTEWVYVDAGGRPRRLPAPLAAWFVGG